MSDYETPPPPDPDRDLTDDLDALDPEAPTDSPVVHPPEQDADRPVPDLDDPDAGVLPDGGPGDSRYDPQTQPEPAGDRHEENAATSLDQPSDQTS